MKYILGLFLFLSVLGDGFNKASRINHTAQEAKAYFNNEHYQKAAALYQYLVDTLGVKDEQLYINLAHAQFLNQDSDKARKHYTTLAKSQNLTIQSIALTQLGLIYFQKDNPERALYHFKKALIQNPGNDVARYNYELMKKYLAQSPPPSPLIKKDKGLNPEEKSRTENNSPNTPAQPSASGNAGTTNDLKSNANNPAQPIPQGSGRGNKGGAGDIENPQQQPGSGIKDQRRSGDKGNNTQGLADDFDANLNAATNKKAGTENAGTAEKELQTLRERLRNTNLTPEKANMLLEAMRQSELQYLQQVPRKTVPQQKKNQPDW